MSRSSMSESSSSTMKPTSKRHSLFISSGPRPLRLVDGSHSPTPQGPSTAPLSSGFDISSPCPPSSSKSPPPISTRPLSRRQSSISYISVEHGTHTPLSPSSRHSLLFSPKSGTGSTSPKEWKSPPPVSAVSERSPVTIVDQHSELLRSIAQKEELCLELRSQLATHEAELLQLKRKWERIMNRGFENTPSAVVNPQGTMLDGIKEGVQGVSRLVTGFALGDASPPPHLNAVPLQTLRSSPRPTHSSSNSSISTYATKSTRFSQSSASSIGEDVLDPGPPASMTASHISSNGSIGSSSDENVLIVHDTGATPVMSPNPAFIAKQHRRDERRQRAMDSQIGFGADLHRRKSRDGSKSPSPLSMTPDSEAGHSSPRPTDEDMEDEKKKRRTSAVTGTFPPIASMPGLTSLMAGTNAQPVSSWVGKKFEELQKGSTFSKSQKRASLLFSDVSQSIASVLSPSPLSATSSPSGKSPAPSYFSPLSTPPLTASTTTSSSLLDEDPDDLMGGSFMKASPIMTPEIRPSLTRKDHSISQPKESLTTKGVKKEDEDEWNW